MGIADVQVSDGAYLRHMKMQQNDLASNQHLSLVTKEVLLGLKLAKRIINGGKQ